MRTGFIFPSGSLYAVPQASINRHVITDKRWYSYISSESYQGNITERNELSS